MSTLRRLSPLAAAPFIGIVCTFALAAPAQALPDPGDFVDVPARTSLTFVHTPTGLVLGTANQNEARPGLSTVKLYMADYALRHGDGSARDRDLAAQMIRFSDDGAASELDNKYPGAISATASEFGLTSTSRGGFWGSSYTSTADTVRFLDAKKRTDLGSPVLEWMKSAGPIAADGTAQNWGTGQLADSTGSKWGWADDGSSVVASASVGDEFTVAANTYGSPTVQTSDVLDALGDVELTSPSAATPQIPPLGVLPTVEDLLRLFAPR